MKKVDFEKVQAGDLVQVPRTQFSQQRWGWNGWLFSDAVIISKGISKKNRKPVIKVEMCIPHSRNNYKTIERTFYADCVFYTNNVEIAKKFLEQDEVSNKEEFYKFIEQDDVTGCDWIRFLIEKGFLF